MKFLLISPKNRTVYNFRGDLIKEIIKEGYEVIVTGPDQTDVDKIEELGARFVEIPMNKTGTSVLKDMRYCKALISLMRKEKPDITLGYTVKPVVYGSIAGKLSGVKNINCMVTGGGYTFTASTWKAKVLGIIVRTLYRIGFTCADHIIFQNKDDLKEFCEKKLTVQSKCSVVNGSGVNVNHYEVSAFPDEISFFMLSRLLKSKGVMEYLQAAELVKREYPNTKFFLLGKYETSMQDAVSREFVEQYINSGIIHRFDETDDVRPYYGMSSVYVLPSYREGTPRTVLEAMSMGRPIITTDTQGCRETVEENRNGFLVPIKCHEELAQKMKLFIEQPELVTIMGAASREYVIEKFEVGKVNADMLRIMKIK